jgi:ureidoglycolate hydrolase
VDYESWRVAILCFEEGPLPGSQTMMERHLETDEVFVLTKGNGSLIVGGNGPEVGELAVQVMEIGKIYNVKKCCWHTVLLSRDASVVIVENRDTVRENSEYVDTTGEQRRWIAEAYQGTNFNSE